MKRSYCPWDFITGGSEGIGAEIGNRLASHGINICMVARNESALIQQRYLEDAYSVRVIASPLDLSRADAVETIIQLTHELDMGFYAHVASYAPLDGYLDTSQ